MPKTTIQLRLKLSVSLSTFTVCHQLAIYPTSTSVPDGISPLNDERPTTPPTIKIRDTNKINKYYIKGIIYHGGFQITACIILIQFGFIMGRLVEIIIWKDQSKSSTKMI